MTESPDHLERLLRLELERVNDRLADQDLYDELYRTLVNRAWSHPRHEGHVALSWKRAEELVNDLRAERGLPPMTLAQTGGEGFPDGTVAQLLGEHGWTSEPLDTARHDDAHLASPADPPRTPPQDTTGGPHEAAEAARRNEVRLSRG